MTRIRARRVAWTRLRPDTSASREPERSPDASQFATTALVHWFNSRRLLKAMGDALPTAYEAGCGDQTAVGGRVCQHG
jgi:hypothetical protein